MVVVIILMWGHKVQVVHREYQGLCCGCTVNVVVAVIILMWGCKVQVVQWQKGIVSIKDCAVAAL
jgi:hypothetical protein